MTTQDIVQKLWSLCHVLRDDGITFHQYLTELTYLLFLKMAKETGTEDRLPAGYRWDDLESVDDTERLNFYQEMLAELGSNSSMQVKAIYGNAQTALRQSKNLSTLVSEIDKLDWYEAGAEGLGDAYEGLLERNAEDKKSGAGQYFTPRVLIESMVALIAPQPGETIQDPAAGTGGFLIQADRHIKAKTDGLQALTKAKRAFQRERAYCGVELVPDTHRLGLMNLMLHGIEGDLILGDSLSPTGAELPKVDVVLTNPPFGTKSGGGMPERELPYPTSNKQLAFLQHIYLGLKPGGRAAVVLPDNVLFESGVGSDTRRDLMDKCNLHTILRLPTGIFYAQGVKTNVLFFTRGKKSKGNTKNIWVYDLRTNMPSFGKRAPFSREHLKPFEAVYGDQPDGTATREEGEWSLTAEGTEKTLTTSRWRCFTREWIAKCKEDSLSIPWLKDADSVDAVDLPDPDVLAAEAMNELTEALRELDGLMAALASPRGSGDKK